MVGSDARGLPHTGNAPCAGTAVSTGGSSTALLPDPADKMKGRRDTIALITDSLGDSRATSIVNSFRSGFDDMSNLSRITSRFEDVAATALAAYEPFSPIAGSLARTATIADTLNLRLGRTDSIFDTLNSGIHTSRGPALATLKIGLEDIAAKAYEYPDALGASNDRPQRSSIDDAMCELFRTERDAPTLPNLDESWAQTGDGVWVPSRVVVEQAVTAIFMLALFSADLKRSAEGGATVAVEDWPQIVRYVMEIVGVYMATLGAVRWCSNKVLGRPTRQDS